MMILRRITMATFVLFAPMFVHADDTGLKLVGAISQSAYGDGETWGSLVPILTDDANAGSCMNLGTRSFTDYLLPDTFALMVPAGATFDGLELQVSAKANNSNDMRSVRPWLIVGGSVTDRQPAVYTRNFYTTSQTTYTYGGATEKWDYGAPTDPEPTISEFNASNFGIRMTFEDDGSGSGDDMYVYAIWVKVYYTPAAAGGSGYLGFFLLLAGGMAFLAVVRINEETDNDWLGIGRIWGNK